MGLLALITPPFRLDRHSIVALVGDAMRDNRCRSIDQLFLVETPLAAPEPYRRWANSFMSLHSRPDGDRSLPSISPKRSDAPGARSPDNRRAEEMKRTITASERRPDPLKSGRSAGEIGFPKLVVRSSGYACRRRS